jgi:hypothetical protein
LEIVIKTIPHKSQRYETVGDYFYDHEGVLQVRVSDMGDEFTEKMVAIHELIEEALTKQKGITEEQITDFDLFYEKKREMGLVKEDSEPGFDNDAPYLMEHTIATGVEMMMCAHAGIKWNEYEHTINSL